MTDERRPQLGGVPLPRPSTVVWITVVCSVGAYFLYNRATANLVAIVGAIIVTALFVAHDRAG